MQGYLMDFDCLPWLQVTFMHAKMHHFPLGFQTIRANIFTTKPNLNISWHHGYVEKWHLGNERGPANQRAPNLKSRTSVHFKLHYLGIKCAYNMWSWCGPPGSFIPCGINCNLNWYIYIYMQNMSISNLNCTFVQCGCFVDIYSLYQILQQILWLMSNWNFSTVILSFSL